MPDQNSTYSIVSEGVKYVATGLLGVLWWDVRKVRLMKDIIMKESDEKYLSKTEHDLRCEVNTLKQNNDLHAHIDHKFEELRADIKTFLKRNGDGKQ